LIKDYEVEAMPTTLAKTLIHFHVVRVVHILFVSRRSFKGRSAAEAKFKKEKILDRTRTHKNLR
jgi:hypothetical protein